MQTQSLSLSATEWASIEHNSHEIEWQGKRFDIQTIEYHTNHVVLHGLFDKVEDNLIASIQNKGTHSKNPISNLTIHFFSFFFFEKINPVHIKPIQFVVLKHASNYLNHYLFNYSRHLSPPPKFLV
jgi:hypothetical protein